MIDWLKAKLYQFLTLDPSPLNPPAGSEYEHVQRFGPSRPFLYYQLLTRGLGPCMGLLVLIPLTLAFPEGFRILLSVISVLVVLFLAGVWLISLLIDFDFRTYLVTDRSLRIREGVWISRELTLTYANIQNIKLEQGPIEQVFGIKRLVVETAGGGSNPFKKKGPLTSHHTGILVGLQNAEEIRDLIQKRIEKPAEAETTVTELDLYKDILAATKRLTEALG